MSREWVLDMDPWIFIQPKQMQKGAGSFYSGDMHCETLGGALETETAYFPLKQRLFVHLYENAHLLCERLSCILSYDCFPDHSLKHLSGFPSRGRWHSRTLCFPEAKISKEWKWRKLGGAEWGDGGGAHNWTCESLWMWWMQIIWQGHAQWGQRGAGAAFNHSGTTRLFVRLGSSHSTPRSACWFREQQKEDDTHGPVRMQINPPPASPALLWTLQMARGQWEKKTQLIVLC